MQPKLMTFLLALSPLVLTACATSGGQRDEQKAPAASSSATPTGTKVMSINGDFEGEIIGTIIPKSKFSKVKIGMSSRQVSDLIGMPNDTSGHLSGKAFIPFYFGSDAYRTEHYYKGEGSLIYAAGGIGGQGERLLKIVVNPKASGYSTGK